MGRRRLPEIAAGRRIALELEQGRAIGSDRVGRGSLGAASREVRTRPAGPEASPVNDGAVFLVARAGRASPLTALAEEDDDEARGHQEADADEDRATRPV